MRTYTAVWDEHSSFGQQGIGWWIARDEEGEVVAEWAGGPGDDKDNVGQHLASEIDDTAPAQIEIDGEYIHIIFENEE